MRYGNGTRWDGFRYPPPRERPRQQGDPDDPSDGKGRPESRALLLLVRGREQERPRLGQGGRWCGLRLLGGRSGTDERGEGVDQFRIGTCEVEQQLSVAGGGRRAEFLA
ncbi:hypothetical protein GMLC_10240 [Geomonas limicola]|uniref:Uncharacterized protein n=1 Tax=Geomonas limicola TaxID=2740186 RepID=A0A6V8N4F9_9BACT|nr:hypothetical protein GMLC_10240 [Geomonas limicola]